MKAPQFIVVPLSTCNPGDNLEIINLDGGYETKSKLYMAGFLPGRGMRVSAKYAGSGAMKVTLSHDHYPKNRFLGHSAADLVLVRRLPKEDKGD